MLQRPRFRTSETYLSAKARSVEICSHGAVSPCRLGNSASTQRGGYTLAVTDDSDVLSVTRLIAPISSSMSTGFTNDSENHVSVWRKPV